MLFGAGTYLRYKFDQEKNRWSQWNRTENLNSIPLSTVTNRGGVLIGEEPFSIGNSIKKVIYYQ